MKRFVSNVIEINGVTDELPEEKVLHHTKEYGK
jgi:hypothetical protein